MSARVLCAGLATLDTIFVVPEPPPRDGRVVAIDGTVAGGGPAATAAVAAARLGADVAFAGAVGDDDAGVTIRDGLAAEGIDVSRLAVVPGARSPRSTILVHEGSGDRAIVHLPGTAAVPLVDTRGFAWVHVDHVGWGRCQRGPARVSVDGGNPIPGLDLAGVALYAPTEAALADAFGTPEAALAAGAETVVVTRGAAGSEAYVAGRDRIVVGAAGADVVSTLGAGDVFHGALVAELAAGESLQTALATASLCAALSCRALDGRSAIPTREELKTP